VTRRRSPGRSALFVGDAGYGTPELARSCHRHRGRLTLVSKPHPRADLFEPPGPYGGDGRPRVRGAARPEPGRAAATAELRAVAVGGDGGGTRDVGITTGVGRRYKSGEASVPIGGVFARDQAGTHRDAYPFGTGPQLDPVALIEAYAGRRDPEATSQGLRRPLGLEATRGRCRRTALRAAPCLSGLSTVVASLSQAPPGSRRGGGVRRPGEAGVTSSDAPTAVRRRLWRGWVFPRAGGAAALEGLPRPLRDVVSYALAPAA
jgi:hypothetical protein